MITRFITSPHKHLYRLSDAFLHDNVRPGWKISIHLKLQMKHETLFVAGEEEREQTVEIISMTSGTE